MEVRPEQIPPAVLRLCRTLESQGHGAWLVGGGLRDVLRGAEPKDWDVATTARPREVGRAFRKVIPTGIQHGTVTVFVDGSPFEVTTLRGDGGYTDGRRPDSVHFVDSIEQDLSRRDFTVNAIAFEPSSGRVIDPFGGLADLAARRLRTVGDPAERFEEDGLRVLRAARFVATLGFGLTEETEAAVSAALPSFAKVSAERVRDEWLKALRASRPSGAFEVMQRTGILAVTCPDLCAQVGLSQNSHHAFDVWKHTMECVDHCQGDAVLRLAALLHDLGKPQSIGVHAKTGDRTFYGHDQIGADLAGVWMERFRFSNNERRRVTHLIRCHLVAYDPQWTDAAVRRFVRRVGHEQMHDLMTLARADVLAKGKGVQSHLQGLAELESRVQQLMASSPPLRATDLAVSGRDLMHALSMKPSPAVGRLLSHLLDHVVDHPEDNERQTLVELARGLPESPQKG